MSCCNDTPTTECGAHPERVRYFPRQLLGAADMIDEQNHRLARMRLHNRTLHGWGVVCGLSVERALNEAGTIDQASTVLTVCPGYALSPQGDEIILDECATIDVSTGLVKPDPCADAWPCPPVTVGAIGEGPVTVYLAIRHAECLARPVRMPPGCGCDEAGCELSRIRSSYELRVLQALPQSHVKARNLRDQWRARVAAWLQDGADLDNQRQPPPVPGCMPCPDQPWVVLSAATVRQTDNGDHVIANIDFAPRLVLWPVWAILAAQGL